MFKECLFMSSMLLASLFLMQAIPSTAATVYVHPWESTIQDGIDAANNGDTVLVDKPVGPYQYTGPGNCDITFHGKQIVVKSIYGAESTPVDIGDSGTRAFIFNSGESPLSKLIGFTMKFPRFSGHGERILLL
ncbi:MAG: hypothetical protein CVT49_14290 [candidate division Zixibacteria bacterium HGW-Zixibacteria-1]|nr:MAG: hypothetical protein CVT49_14290 [candidate division Zixibacteria bacterium HGW-Zixibacteria-1]